MLNIHHLNAGYEDLRVLFDISLSLDRGSISVLMGPNGAGKSTLLKSIFNLTNRTSGNIVFDGRDITHEPAYRLIDLGIGFVPQGRINFGTLCVRENLLLGAHHVQDRRAVAERLEQVYAQFPMLKDHEHRLALRLSGGQQQMLAIGRALVGTPRLLLMDEPSLGLAPSAVKDVFRRIVQIRNHFGCTILIVEHNIKSLMDVADYGFVMVQGRIVAHDVCESLKNSEIMKQVFVGVFD